MQENELLRKIKSRYEENNDIKIDDDSLTIKTEKIDSIIPVLNEVIDEYNYIEFETKTTLFEWNGSILNIKGYCFIKDIPMLSNFDVKKRLILANGNNKYQFVLEDITLSELGLEDSIDEKYKWAGFGGSINFSIIAEEGNKPLPGGTYETYIETEIASKDAGKIVGKIPLGDIRDFLKDGFYSTIMEFYSARLQMLYNLMVTYDVNSKSVLLNSTRLKNFDPTKLYGDIKNKTKKPGVFYRLMRTKMFSLLYYIFNIFPVKNDQILFASDSRAEIGGNFEFVYKELKSRNIQYKYKFMLKENSFVKKTFFEIVRLAYYVATSKVTLLEENHPMISGLRIRKNSELIQLWHGAGAFKKFGYSRLGQPGGPKINSKDHRNYTKAVVSSKNVISHYAEGFDIEEDIIYPLGIPRTDIFFDEDYKRNKREEIYEEHPYLKGKKVILFAPTFRGRSRKEAHYPIDYLDFEKLYGNLKDEYVFLFKLHFIVLNKVTIPHQYADFFYDFTDYREVNDLLLIADILITDYSSICFEFSLLNKPMLFLAYDVEDYISKRGFYFEYQSFIPGKLVKSTDELVECFLNNDFDEEKIKKFRDYFFDYQDGKSSQRVVDQLILGDEWQIKNK